jgi:hypothetical protein
MRLPAMPTQHGRAAGADGMLLWQLKATSCLLVEIRGASDAPATGAAFVTSPQPVGWPKLAQAILAGKVTTPHTPNQLPQDLQSYKQ